MSRLTGWVILVAASSLIYSLALTPYEAWTGSWRTTDSGGLVKITVECPTPFADLVLGAEPERTEDVGVCQRSARTLTVEAGFVALGAVLLTWGALTRPRPTKIQPLSSVLNLDGDPSPDWGREETRGGSGRADPRR